MTQFNVKELIAACCAKVESLKKPGVEFRSSVSDGIDEAHTGQDRLRDIIINLLANAVKFTEQGEVVVCVEEEEDGASDLVISVSDTGPGIPEEDIETILKDYNTFRQRVSDSDRTVSTRLGLMYSMEYAEVLGGRICIESEVGKGSTFTVRIPMIYSKD